MQKFEGLDIDSLKKKKDTYCANCGKKGHVYKYCIYPITSLGIICIEFKNININYLLNKTKKLLDNHIQIGEYKKIKQILSNIDEHYINTNLKYLVVRRKNSLSVVEFLRGKYSLNDIDYLKNTFSLMTIVERNDIINKKFDNLWNDLWNIDNESQIHKNEYDNAKTKFDSLKNGITIYISNIPIFINLENIVKSTSSKWTEPEWGFPKGRRNLKEKDLSCASREFNEETNFTYDDYQLLTIDKMVEIFMGTNNIKYKHIYYIAQTIGDKVPKLNKNNKNQLAEIGDINFVNYQEALLLIREYNLEKKNVLTNLHSLIKIILLTSKELFYKFENKYNNENNYCEEKII